MNKNKRKTNVYIYNTFISHKYMSVERSQVYGMRSWLEIILKCTVASETGKYRKQITWAISYFFWHLLLQ